MSDQENTAKTVTLIKPHRHAGRDYPVGATLPLPGSKAKWLQGIGVAAKDADQSATVATPEEA